MKRPVLVARSERTTNAPTEVVIAHLLDATSWSRWALTPFGAVMQVDLCGKADIRIDYTHRVTCGLNIAGVMEVRALDEHVLLVHQAKISGWLVLLVMGYYRWRIEMMWPRFVAQIPQPTTYLQNGFNAIN